MPRPRHRAVWPTAEQSEDAPLLDPLVGDVMESMESYGPAKVACEEAVRNATGTATIDGTFNATGPTTTLGEVLAESRRVAGSTARVHPLPLGVLESHGVAAWMGNPSVPLWIDDPDWRWFATMDTRRARAAGPVTRALAETLRDALAHEQTRNTPRGAGLTDEEERALRVVAM